MKVFGSYRVKNGFLNDGPRTCVWSTDAECTSVSASPGLHDPCILLGTSLQDGSTCALSLVTTPRGHWKKGKVLRVSVGESETRDPDDEQNKVLRLEP